MSADDTSRDALVEGEVLERTGAALRFLESLRRMNPSQSMLDGLVEQERDMWAERGPLMYAALVEERDLLLREATVRDEHEVLLAEGKDCPVCTHMTHEDAYDELEALREAIGDAWEAFGYDRSGARSSRVEFGPAGGPFVTVDEAHDYTLAEFINTVTPGLEDERTQRDAAIKRAEAAEAAHRALANAVRAEANAMVSTGDGRWRYELRSILEAHGATNQREEQS